VVSSIELLLVGGLAGLAGWTGLGVLFGMGCLGWDVCVY